MAKKTKTEIDSHSYDVIYVPYLVNQWIRDITTNMHIRHVRVTKNKLGTSVTLEAISLEEIPVFEK